MTTSEPSGCCADLEMALDHGLIVRYQGELLLPLRLLTEVHPNATAGNVLTGEEYDPNEFTVTMAISFCPFCGHRFTPLRFEEVEFDPFELEALCDSDD